MKSERHKTTGKKEKIEMEKKSVANTRGSRVFVFTFVGLFSPSQGSFQRSRPVPTGLFSDSKGSFLRFTGLFVWMQHHASESKLN